MQVIPLLHLSLNPPLLRATAFGVRNLVWGRVASAQYTHTHTQTVLWGATAQKELVN